MAGWHEAKDQNEPAAPVEPAAIHAPGTPGSRVLYRPSPHAGPWPTWDARSPRSTSGTNLCQSEMSLGGKLGTRAAWVVCRVVCSFYARSGALRHLEGAAWAGCERLPGGSALHWPALTSSSPEHVQQECFAHLTTTERPRASRDVSQKPYTIGYWLYVRRP